MLGFVILPFDATSRQSPGALGGNRGSVQPPTAPRSILPPNSCSRQWRLTAGSPSGNGAQFTWRASMISRRPVVLSSFSHGFVLRMGEEGGHHVPERDGFVRRPPFPSRTFAYDASLLCSCGRGREDGEQSHRTHGRDGRPPRPFSGQNHEKMMRERRVVDLSSTPAK